MLTHLHIKDLAIVSSLALDMDQGMTALTGETGAGKSILIDALSLALGHPTDNNMIRTGCDRAEISVAFDVSDSPDGQAWLRKHDLYDNEDCILRRVLVRDGRSRSFINGRPAPMAQTRELAEKLIDIHGQHAHQALLRQRYQRYLLDAYGKHLALSEKVTTLFRLWHNAQKSLIELKQSSQERADRLELLRYQSSDIQALELTKGEWQQLDQDQTRLSHVDSIQQACGNVITEIYEADNCAQSVLVSAQGKLDEVIPLEPRLKDPRDLVEAAQIQIQEAVSSLRAYLDNLDLDPAQLQQVEQRLTEIHTLARKYRVKPEELQQRLTDINADLDTLEQADQHIDDLEQEVAELEKEFLKHAAILSKKRKSGAKKLGKAVSDFMQTLGMEGGVFSVSLHPLKSDEATAAGLELVEYLVSANPGHPPLALTKVASGGELSRISLAIQVATAQCGTIPTLIFDEVDVGIGGGVAETVGQLLHQLGDTRQVLCVTHLPQVAAQGHHHLNVSKQTKAGKTQSGIKPLVGNERIKEIARMLGGIKITKQTLAHAKEMIDQAQA